MTGYDWDALAPHWHLFEDRGFADTLVRSLVRERVPAPVLFVGAGLGRYAAALRDQVGPVIAVDRSPRMAARGSATRRLPFIVADARALPFVERAFATVVCASGVIEGMCGADRAAVLRELGRVSQAGFYLAAFVIRDGAPTVDVHAAIRAWEAGAIANHAFDEVARELGSVRQAAALLSRALPACEPAVTERAVIDSAAEHELSVRRVEQDDRRGVALWFLGAKPLDDEGRRYCSTLRMASATSAKRLSRKARTGPAMCSASRAAVMQRSQASRIARSTMTRLWRMRRRGWPCWAM